MVSTHEEKFSMTVHVPICHFIHVLLISKEMTDPFEGGKTSCHLLHCPLIV